MATAAQCFIPLSQVSGNAAALFVVNGSSTEPALTRMNCQIQYMAGVAGIMAEIIGGAVAADSSWMETGYSIVPSSSPGTCDVRITYQKDAGNCGTASMVATMTVPAM